MHITAQSQIGQGPLGLRVTKHQLFGEVQTYDHDFVLMSIVLKGQGVHQTTQGKHNMRSGEVFILRPGLWHRYDQCRNLHLYNCYMAMRLFREHLRWMYADLSLSDLLLGPMRQPTEQGCVRLSLEKKSLSKCKFHLDALCDDEAGQNQLPTTQRLGHLLLLLGELVTNYQAKQQATLPSQFVRQPYHRAVIQGVELLEQTYNQEWSLDEVARQLHIAPSYLVRLFKAQIQLSPMAYLAQCRAERAAGLLLRTNLNMTIIAQKVGWPDPNYFARRFKSHFGVSASNYRKQHQHD